VLNLSALQVSWSGQNKWAQSLQPVCSHQPPQGERTRLRWVCGRGHRTRSIPTCTLCWAWGAEKCPQPLGLPCRTHAHTKQDRGSLCPCPHGHVARALCWPTPCTPRRDGQCAGRDGHHCPSRSGTLAAERAGGGKVLMGGSEPETSRSTAGAGLRCCLTWSCPPW